ncbi:MAG: RNA polymerase sigma factor [Angustibacter sp.]
MGVTLPPFQDLVDAHWRDVARLAHALAGPGDGDDVAQQAWTQALAAYPRIRSSRNLRSWLLTITARCATDAHRGRARRPVPQESLPDRPGGDVVEDAVLPDQALWDQVRGLPERQRTALVLRYVTDLDHRAVAAALGTTPTASRRLVSDALIALRHKVVDPDATPSSIAGPTMVGTGATPQPGGQR